MSNQRLTAAEFLGRKDGQLRREVARGKPRVFADGRWPLILEAWTMMPEGERKVLVVERLRQPKRSESQYPVRLLHRRETGECGRPVWWGQFAQMMDASLFWPFLLKGIEEGTILPEPFEPHKTRRMNLPGSRT